MHTPRSQIWKKFIVTTFSIFNKIFFKINLLHINRIHINRARINGTQCISVDMVCLTLLRQDKDKFIGSVV